MKRINQVRTREEDSRSSRHRCLWTAQEDKLLSALTQQHGARRWRCIADTLTSVFPGTAGRKTPKQCRERWCTHLDPAIVAAPWSSQEQDALFRTHRAVGNRWAEIAEKLPGRTSNAIKNFFFCKLRKLIRNIKNKVCEMSGEGGKALQVAYLLSHLYTQYIVPQKEGKLTGDKYITDMFSKEPALSDYFAEYAKNYLLRLSVESARKVLAAHPELGSFLDCESIRVPNDLTSRGLESAPTCSTCTSNCKSNAVTRIGELTSGILSSAKLREDWLTLPMTNFEEKADLRISTDKAVKFDFAAYSNLILERGECANKMNANWKRKEGN